MNTHTDTLTAALAHFEVHDPLLFAWAKRAQLSPIVPSEDLFLRICDSIISQQLSTKAADAILNRFLQLFSEGLSPTTVAALEAQTIRDVGISWAKVRSLQDLADALVAGRLDLDALPQLSDEHVINALCQVKGIGPWTAEMILMFGLGRLDLYSHGDLGLKKGMQKIYGLSSLPTVEEVQRITASWSPYRTYGCRVLWRSLELTDVS